MKAYRQGNDIAVTWPFKDKITGEPFDFSGLEVAVTAQIGNCRPMKMDITITGNVITFTHAGKDQPSVGVVTLTLFCNKNISGMVTLDTKDGYEIVAHSWEAEGYDEGEISTDGVYLESTIDAGIRGADAGFGTIDAEVDDTTGTPSVDVTTSGPNTAKNIHFAFSGLKGERGADGSDADVTRENIESALNGTPGKNLSTEDFTASDKSKLEGIEAGAQKNVKSDWNAASGDAEILNKPDLSQYITKSVDDLVNYYLKSDTYTKAEVQALIGAIQQFHYEVYPTLADVTSPASNVLYLIGPTGTGTDKYEEYVWPDVQTGFVKIGDTSIDLSGYVTTGALNTALADYTTTANLTTLLAGKQDTISDLAAIRSGADAGATAYQKPSGGIPSSDMALGVQTSLGKADTAEQTSNKTTTLSASSTDTQYPSAKAVYDALYENVLISLGVNSAGTASDLIGLKVTVTNADTFEQISEQTWNGTPLVVRIKAGVRYTVSTQAHPDYVTPASQTFTSEIASTRSVGFIYVYSAVIDLSYRDTDGTKKTVQDTANSYVARVAGDYKLPAVYGNAIKNGSANAAAYTRQGSTYTADFVNYKGAQITSPYIETDTGETIASAALLWQTGTNLISNVAFSNGYVTFTVNSIPAENGLAVLAVKDGNGDIMWSWTIWLTTDTLTAEKFTNYTEVDYYLMPENLFCIWNEQRTNYGTAMIQWGRKDAFVPNVPGRGSQMTVYDIEGNAITAGTALGSVIGVLGTSDDQSPDKTVANSIKNPGMFFTRYDSTNNNWNNLAWFNNFWNAAETSSASLADNQDTAIKTIYDPCPFGWMLPAGRAFTGFTTTGAGTSTASQFKVVGSWSNGWNFKRNSDDTTGNKFIASGCRASGSGAFTYVGDYGYSWSFAPYLQAYASYLFFYSGGVYPQYNGCRCFGFAVRPCQEPA